MRNLGQELDVWLRKTQTGLKIDTSKLTDLSGMRKLFKEVKSGQLPSLDLLKDTEALQGWIKIWAAEHDTPE